LFSLFIGSQATATATPGNSADPIAKPHVAGVLRPDRLSLGKQQQGLAALRGQVLQVIADAERDTRTLKAALSEILPATYPGPGEEADEDARMTRLLTGFGLLTDIRTDMQGVLEAVRHAEAGVPMPDGRKAMSVAQGLTERALERHGLLASEMKALHEDLHSSPFGRPSPAESRALNLVRRAMLGLEDTERRLARMSDAMAGGR